MENFFLQLFFALVSSGTLLWVLKEFFGYISNKLRSRNKSVVAIQKSAYIFESLNRIVAGTGAKRGLILQATNGGGIMRADTNLFGSILYEIWETGVTSRKGDWERVRLGQEYIGVLKRLTQEKEIILEAKDVEELRLKSLYEADKINHSILIELKKADERYLYLSLPFQTAFDQLKPQEYVLIQTEVGRLRELLED